jgi:mycothiol synthase
MPLPPGFTLRPARDEDAEPVVAFTNDEAEALVGFRPDSADFRLSWWTAPSVVRENDIAVVEAPDGTLCACLNLGADPPYAEIESLNTVALPYHGRGLGAALLAESERRAARFVQLADPRARVVMHQDTLAGELRAGALLAANGYREVRRFELMRIDFGRELEPPTWPPGIEVRTLREEDAGKLYEANCEAFADHWGEGTPTEEDFRHYVYGSPRFDPLLWFIPWSGDEIAGYCGTNLEAEEDPLRGYVAELGVRPAYRRQGLGEALLRHAFRELRARGKRGCDLHVDAESLTGATRLYERVGMTPYPRFATWEKELRPAAIPA